MIDQLDEVFKLMYLSICDIGKWIFAIKMASDIINNGNNGDIQGIIHGILNGAFGYGSLYAIVGILDAVQSKFM